MEGSDLVDESGTQRARGDPGGKAEVRAGMHPPVLDLQQVADQAVTGAALHEAALRAEEGLGGVAAVLLQEVIEQGELRLFLHLVDGHGVDHWLDHAAVGRNHENLVRLDPQGHALLIPDGL